MAIPIPNNWILGGDDQILDNQLHDTESLGAVGYVENRRHHWYSLELVVIAGGLGEEG